MIKIYILHTIYQPRYTSVNRLELRKQFKVTSTLDLKQANISIFWFCLNSYWLVNRFMRPLRPFQLLLQIMETKVVSHDMGNPQRLSLSCSDFLTVEVILSSLEFLMPLLWKWRGVKRSKHLKLDYVSEINMELILNVVHKL